MSDELNARLAAAKAQGAASRINDPERYKGKVPELSGRQIAALELAKKQGGDGCALVIFQRFRFGDNLLAQLISFGLFDVKGGSGPTDPARLKLTAKATMYLAGLTPLSTEDPVNPEGKEVQHGKRDGEVVQQ